MKITKFHTDPLQTQAGILGVQGDIGVFERVFPVPVGFTSVAGVVPGVNLSLKIYFRAPLLRNFDLES